MQEITVLAGGKTGYGITDAGIMLCRLFSRLGYRIYMYNDFPSLIKGGHQFVLVRACSEQISAHSDKADLVIAFNQDALELHRERFGEDTLILYDSAEVNPVGFGRASAGLPLGQLGILGMAGAVCRALDTGLEVLETLIEKHYSDSREQNLEAARKGFELSEKMGSLAPTGLKVLPAINGSQAVCLGLLKAGLKAYVAYPMTPTSPVLEFFAKHEPDLGLQVVTPESEIAVMLMSLGYSYMGIRNAVGTSGGGFSLMVEGLGLAGQGELPAVIVLGQRAGPSTGMPTYTAQSDLGFVLNAGQGEFPRLVAAPGDAEEAWYWSGVAMNKAWKYQIPAFILADKTLCLGTYSFDLEQAGELEEEQPVLWDGEGEYRRYAVADDGVSPLAFAPIKGQAVKTTSYVHDEYGLTTEDPAVAKALADRRAAKWEKLTRELEGFETVKTYGQGRTALLFWGTNKGVCVEISEKLGLKAVQLMVLSPFPEKALAKALQGVEKVIIVECSSQGQLEQVMMQHGLKADGQILKYDGRPFSLEDLEKEVKKVMK